jgi:predicted DCC family thiol-disulfide oxidoreductase YuxK
VVAGAYFFTGLARVLFSGPAWFVSDDLRFALYASSDAQSVPNTVGLLVADRPWLAHALAAGVLAFELSFPIVLWRPRWAWAFVLGAAALHLGIWATMHLDYSAWIATVAVVLIDWPRIVDRLAAKARPNPGLTPSNIPTYAGGVERAILLYDADCGFCRWSISKVLAWDRDRSLRAVPLQSVEADELLPDMDLERKMASWHLVTGGEVYSGGAAVSPLARSLPAGAPIAWLAELSPHLTDLTYRSVAARRERIGRALGEQACAVDLNAASPARAPSRSRSRSRE